MATTKKDKARQLLEKLKSLEAKKSLTLQGEVSNLVTKLKDNFAVKTLKSVEKIGAQVDQFKTDFNLKPVMAAIADLEAEMTQGEQDLRTELLDYINSIPQTPDLTPEVMSLQSQLKSQGLGMTDLKLDIENFQTQLQNYIDSDIEEDKLEKQELDAALSKLRLEVMQRINNIGGGSMNRQELFNGVDRLTKYTDINWKAGSNVTFTIANNDTTKRVDVTVAASGGGGGGGITRVINSISVSTAADSAAATDYIYLCSGTLTLTLPDASLIGTNLYTIKNVGNGTVTVATTTSQTIDGALTQVMPVKFTSIDVDSDGTNWNIT